MRSNLLLIIVFFLLCSSSLEAQKDVSVKRREFKAGKSGFRDAWKHVKEGDNFYVAKGLWYGNAFDEYLKAVLYNNSNPELNYKLGASALFCDRKEEAAGFLLKALELKSSVADDILFLAGRGLQYSGKYSEALEKYNSYLTSKVRRSKEEISKTKKYIEECNSALNLKDTLRIEISNIGNNINSSSDDFSELLSGDGSTMFFGTRRKMAGSSNYYADTKFDENIFVSHLNNGEWEIAKSAGKNLHTKYCETPLFVNSTNDRLYLYAGYENGGDIKVSKNKRGKWRSPESVSYRINSSNSETSFCFTPSGNEIYFVTESGKGNVGGKDIYFIQKTKGRRWSKPKNAGSSINTVYDEESVRFSKDGDTLWFSSKGHNSIGGFDVFYSVKNAKNEWDTVKNIGYPLNTPWDEIFYLPSPSDSKAFYFTSNRSGGYGGLDIYSGRILPPPPPPVEIIAPPPPPPPVIVDTVIVRDTVVVEQPVIPPPAPVVKQDTVVEVVLYLIGKITDSESGEPVLAKIDVIDINTDLVVVTTASSDVDGSYRVRLPARKSYMIDLRATGFLSDMKRINISDTYTKDVYTLDVPLIKVKVGKKVVLKSIMFESGKSVLTPGSYAEIDELLKILQENALMKIEISGHTDKTGSEPLNFKLSESRAKAVMDYLIKKGIDMSRMEYKGYGSLQPISDNSTPQGRAKNRRVEFKILEF